MTDLAQLQKEFTEGHFLNGSNYLENHVSTQAIRTVRATLPIRESGEPLVMLPMSLSRAEPHPYEQAGASYDPVSPWVLRKSVVERLCQVQAFLERKQPGNRLYLHDAYRPLSVQQFMIDAECNRLAQESAGLLFSALESEQQQSIRQTVSQFWASPNPDSAVPPPHSTGGAVDLTILDAQGKPLLMGCAIDELCEQAYPSFYRDSISQVDRQYHANRQLLVTVMCSQGFHQLPTEWWHFSYGDQTWAMIESLGKAPLVVPALYGRVDTEANDN